MVGEPSPSGTWSTVHRMCVFETSPDPVGSTANPGPPPLLYVNSKDSAHPLWFQAVMAGEEADAAKLGSPREYASVLDQIEFLIAMTGEQKHIAKQLNSLRRKLDATGAKTGKKPE